MHDMPAATEYHHEYAVMAELAEARKAEVFEAKKAEAMAILSEITKLTRHQRSQQEELREERKNLVLMEGQIRAQRAELSEERARFQAEAYVTESATSREVAESRQSMGEELRMLTSELQQEREERKAIKIGMDATKNLYEKKCDNKDQEIRDLREALADRNLLKAQNRELRDELRAEREARVRNETVEEKIQYLEDGSEEEYLQTALQVASTAQANNARRRLSYSATASNNEPILQAQESTSALALPLDAFQESTSALALPLEGLQVPATETAIPSAPSSSAMPAAGTGDTRRRLSYSRAAANVETETPETPAVDPSKGGMAQKLFDSQLEASSVNNTILATPLTVEVSFPAMDLSFATAIIEECSTAHASHPAELTPLVLDNTPSSTSVPCVAVALSSHPLPACSEEEHEMPTELHDKTPSCMTGQQTTSSDTIPQKVVSARVPPIAKAAAKPSSRPKATVHELAASRRSASERGRAPREAERSPRSPMRFSMSATPPRVQKESPPRGCVKEKVSMFEQRCTTPAGSLNTPRQGSTSTVPDALRRGPRGAPVPTPSCAGAAATSASRACRAEEKVVPHQERAAPKLSSAAQARFLGPGHAIGETGGSPIDVHCETSE
jgi:hypothetical protein